MRIALYHNVPSGGAKRAIYEWVRRLADNHVIDVYSLETANHSFCDIRPLVHEHRVYPFAPLGLFRSPFGRLNQLQRWRDLDRLDRLSRLIAGEINGRGYDVLFANTCILTFIPLLLQYVDVPAVYFLHEPFGRGVARKFRRPYLQTNAWRSWLDERDPLIKLYQSRLATGQQKSAGRARLLLANSHFTMASMPNEFHSKTAACSYGVDATALRPTPGIQKENFVVSVGELSPRKGFDFVIESLGSIPAENRPQLKLACNRVEPQEKEFLQALAGRCEVDLQLLTNLNTGDLRRLYNQARLCVYAPYLEPFGLVPLEAMACGTPVVGVKEGGVQESVLHGETGLLIERDPAKFGEAILRLLCDCELAATMGRRGREHVAQRWTWERSVTQLESSLLQCAS